MASTGRIPLWLIATVGGTAALTVVGLFIFGANEMTLDYMVNNVLKD